MAPSQEGKAMVREGRNGGTANQQHKRDRSRKTKPLINHPIGRDLSPCLFFSCYSLQKLVVPWMHSGALKP